MLLKTFFHHSSIPNARMLWLFCALLFALSLPVEAQQPTKMPRVGYLSPRSSSRDATRRQGFQQGLRELGYSEGQNIVVEYRFADGQLERLHELAADLVR